MHYHLINFGPLYIYDQNICKLFLSLILSYETVNDLSFFISSLKADL